MRKKILFVYANPLSPQKMHLPYGLLWLRQNLPGCNVKIVDAFLEFSDPAAGIKELVTEFQPDLVGLGIRNIDSQTSMELTQFNFEPPEGSFKTIYCIPGVLNLVSAIKEALGDRDVPILAGGGGFQAAPKAILEHLGLTYGIIGPGEKSLADFISAYFSGKPLTNVPGLLTRRSDSGWDENPRLYCGDDFTHLIRIADIPENLKSNLDKITVGLKTRYGCPGACSYCLDPLIEGPKMRYRQMDDIFRQLLEFSKDSRINKIHFTDPEFNMPDVEFSTALLKEIVKRGFDMRFAFSSQFTAGTLPREFVELMRKARLRDFAFTVDSVSDEVLRLNGKRYTQDAIKRNIDACLDNGLFMMINIIVGMPGETRKTLEETVAFCKRYEKAPLQFSYVFGLRVYENTPLGRLIADDYPARSRNLYGRRTEGWMEPSYYSEAGSPLDHYQYFKRHLGGQANVTL